MSKNSVYKPAIADRIAVVRKNTPRGWFKQSEHKEPLISNHFTDKDIMWTYNTTP